MNEKKVKAEKELLEKHERAVDHSEYLKNLQILVKEKKREGGKEAPQENSQKISKEELDELENRIYEEQKRRVREEQKMEDELEL